ncbi:MoaD/ThiS family protein [Methanococcoides sp. SA1]|nr:MoaD/ThiS family protein [Methanococcoides sp. SA1]
MVGVKIKLFANLREIAGVSEIELKGENIQEILDILLNDHPQVQDLIYDDVNGKKEIRAYINILVNGNNIQHLEGPDTVLNEGDEIAIFPPVSGG